MDRRKFLKFLGFGSAAVVATAAIDPEELLWKPGAKTFFLPPQVPVIRPLGWGQSSGLVKGDVVTIDGVFATNPHTRQLITGAKQHFVVTDVHDSGVINVSPRPRGNTFLTVDMVTMEALRVLEERVRFTRDFSICESVRIRKPQRFSPA